MGKKVSATVVRWRDKETALARANYPVISVERFKGLRDHYLVLLEVPDTVDLNDMHALFDRVITEAEIAAQARELLDNDDMDEPRVAELLSTLLTPEQEAREQAWSDLLGTNTEVNGGMVESYIAWQKAGCSGVENFLRDQQSAADAPEVQSEGSEPAHTRADQLYEEWWCDPGGPGPIDQPHGTMGSL